MADVFTIPSARTAVSVIAAGGTAGALAGPALATLGSRFWDPWCCSPAAAWDGADAALHQRAGGLVPRQRIEATTPDPPAVGGGVAAGFTLVARSPYLLGICTLMLFFTTLATFLYFQQAHAVRDAFADTASRTAVFAAVDLATNVLTLAASSSSPAGW